MHRRVPNDPDYDLLAIGLALLVFSICALSHIH